MPHRNFKLVDNINNNVSNVEENGYYKKYRNPNIIYDFVVSFINNGR